jgi:hypothetical protein
MYSFKSKSKYILYLGKNKIWYIWTKRFSCQYSTPRRCATNSTLLIVRDIYAPSSSLLQGKYLPFSPSPLRLNIFRLFVILLLTQFYRYTPEIFLFSTATFKYTYRAPLRRIGQEYSANVAWYTFQSLKRIQPLPVCAGFFICIRNSLDRPCVTMPSWSFPLKCKVSLYNTDNCSNADYKNMFNSKLLTFDF